jgi:hypothetical protein
MLRDLHASHLRQFNLETQAWKGEEEAKVLNSLEFLQSVYRDDQQPLSTRIRCAVKALAFERPKLAAIAHMDGSFAELLDKAIEQRSRKALLIEAVPTEPVPTKQQLPPEVLNKPMSKLRRF